MAEISDRLARARLGDGRITATVNGKPDARLEVSARGSDVVAQAEKGKFSVLSTGDGHVAVETTVENLEAAGGDTYANYVGDYLNGMGQLESWTTADPLSFTSQGVGELLATWGYRALTYFGSRDATGVD